MRIAVFGMGGIGGVLGGALARTFPEDITFIARGKRKAALEKDGLTVHSDLLGEFTAHPAEIIDSAALSPENATGNGAMPEAHSFAPMDVVLVCVKNTGIHEAAKAIRPLVDDNTLIIPAMNGLSAGEVLKEYYPNNPISEAVLYVVAYAKEDYSLLQLGKFTRIRMNDLGGTDDSPIHGTETGAEKVAALVEMFNAAGLDAKASSHIKKDLWNKYAFNCAFNTMTAALACNAKVIKEENNLQDFRSIVTEVFEVAKAEGIEFTQEAIDKHVDTMLHTSGGSDSSLSRDFAEGKTGEMEMFSGDLLRRGEKVNVALPVLTKYYEMLKKKATKMH